LGTKAPPQTPTRFPVATARNVARCLPYPGEIQRQLPKIQGHRGEQAVVPCQPAASSLIGAVDALFRPELRILKYSKAIQSRTESARILLADAVVSCARLGRRSNLVNVKISTSQLILDFASKKDYFRNSKSRSRPRKIARHVCQEQTIAGYKSPPVQTVLHVCPLDRASPYRCGPPPA